MRRQKKEKKLDISGIQKVTYSPWIHGIITDYQRKNLPPQATFFSFSPRPNAWPPLYKEPWKGKCLKGIGMKLVPRILLSHLRSCTFKMFEDSI